MPAPLDIAKVFTTGRSQAVRLPKAYRFATAEVTIERQGEAVILRPKLNRAEWWEALQSLSRQAVEEFPLVDRERGNLKAPVSFDE